MSGNGKTDKRPSGPPKVLAITGGKGGVGKTTVSLNLSLTLSRLGHRVLLMDGDTDLANVTIMLGMIPETTLEHVINGECNLEDIVVKGPAGLDIIPGASGVERCIDMEPKDSVHIFRALSKLEKNYDYIIIDTAAGLQANVLHMVAAATMACVVITPDPTSMTDAFSLLKTLRRRGYRRPPSVLVNMAGAASEAKAVFQKFADAVNRHLEYNLHFLGAVWRDETVRSSVTRQSPVAMLPQTDPASRQFRVLSDMVRVRLNQLPQRKAGLAGHWFQVSQKKHKAPGPVLTEPELTREAQQLIERLGDILDDRRASSMLKYEAFTACFSLLGRHMDDDTIEIVQTGVASLNWQSLRNRQRRHFADHLRTLADQISPTEKDDDEGPLLEQVAANIREEDRLKLAEVLNASSGKKSLEELLQWVASDKKTAK